MLFVKAVPEWNEKTRKDAAVLIEGFVRAGNHVTAFEWSMMDSVERELMVRARRKYDLELAMIQTGDFAVAEAYCAMLPEEERAPILSVISAMQLAKEQQEKGAAKK